MSDLRPAPHKKRSIWRWALAGGFALSVLVNLTVALKIAVFDSNYPFQPICHGGRHVGMVVLNEPMNERFKERMPVSLANSRQSEDWVLFISYWDWRYKKEYLWNVSRATAEYLYEKHIGIKRMSDDTREKLQTARCKFIRKWALMKPKSQ